MNSGWLVATAMMSRSGERPPRLRLMPLGEITFACACVARSWTQVESGEFASASAALGSARAALSGYTVAPRTTKAAAAGDAGKKLPVLIAKRPHVRRRTVHAGSCAQACRTRPRRREASFGPAGRRRVRLLPRGLRPARSRPDPG